MSNNKESAGETVTQATTEYSSTAGEQGMPVTRPKRDFWDYVEILARPIAGSLTALAIAWIGVVGNTTLKEQQRQESLLAREAVQAENLRAAAAQDHRLFTDLVSKREDAETGLRKDMFNTILKDFFKDQKTDGDAGDLRKRLLKLEMLALNFGESLSLTPLFIEFDQEIYEARGEGGDFAMIDWIDQRDRLHSLARRVSARQISALAPGGKIFEFDVPVGAATDHDTFRWPDDVVGSDDDASVAIARTIALSDIELDGIKRTYTAEFSRADNNRKTVGVYIEIQTWDGETDEPLPGVTEMEFELNFFNFPMVDNTRLSDDQRFAFIMERFGELNIHVVGVIFRGMYSSSRDKPFLDDVINQLKRREQEEDASTDEDSTVEVTSDELQTQNDNGSS